MEIIGKIFCKKGDNTAFALEKNDWYNIPSGDTALQKVIEGLSKGDTIVVLFDKKGIKKTIQKIGKPAQSSSIPEVVTHKDASVSQDALPSTVKTETTATSTAVKQPWTPKSDCNSAERQSSIQRGNALNAAAAIMSNPNLVIGQDTTIEAVVEVTKGVAEELLAWLRQE